MAEEADITAVKDEILREILRVHEESYGAGMNNAQVHVSEEFVLVILDVELAISERTLMEAGRGEAVKTMRESFQGAIAPTFTAIIERATGRRVRNFISAMSLEPVYSIELFRLEPRAD